MKIGEWDLDLKTEAYLGGGLYWNPCQYRFEIRHATRGVIGWVSPDLVRADGPWILWDWWESFWPRWADYVRAGL